MELTARCPNDKRGRAARVCSRPPSLTDLARVFDLPVGQVTVGPRLNVFSDCDDCDPSTKTLHDKNVVIRLCLPARKKSPQ